VRLARRIREVSREAWDRLAGDASPFLRWDWLDCLEQTGCASRRTGWAPHHLLVEKNGTLVAACPLYLKGHSMGEFVFDHAWADYAARAGIRYYPKLLVAVPFTPVSGPRFLTDPAEPRAPLVRLMAEQLAGLCAEHGISSAHVNFCAEDEVEILAVAGYLHRSGLQFHWENRGYRGFDDYLADFRSDRRNKIQRERRELRRQGITIRAVENESITPSLMRTMFRLYKNHIDRLDYGQQYLTRSFFEEIADRLREHLCLFVAEKEGRVVAGTFNLRGRDTLYGRYWGVLEDHPFLHFNVCYYAAIEHCIERGIARFEAGAGGSFKQLRGLDPRPTHSMHYIADESFRRALAPHLKKEEALVEEKRRALLAASPLKSTRAAAP
jgi:predicted N-acyltransferase